MASTDESSRAHVPATRSALHTRIAANLAAIDARVDAAARAAGRSDRPRLVAVTKTVGALVARALCELGRVDLAENRLQVLEPKWRELNERPPRDADGTARPPRWHFVGHLQRNKVAAAIACSDVVHSIDSMRLLDAVAEAATRAGRTIEVFLQVKLWPEADKGGFEPAELGLALDRLAACPALVPQGLMTMAPLVEEETRAAAARTVFEGVADLGRAHASRPWAHGRALLSMGMSDDLEEAVAAGSDWLRIGRALFEGLPSLAANEEFTEDVDHD